MKWTDQSPSADLPIADLQPANFDAQRILASNKRSAARTQVTIDVGVHQAVLAHLRTSNNEQGGLLLGRAWGEPNDPAQAAWVEVTAAVPATDSSGNGYSLRMGAGVWSAANSSLEELKINSTDQPDSRNQPRIIGWYHSHPGLGAFFSSTDCATQAAFFTNAYSIGWVIDPSDDTHACFVGPASDPVALCALV